MTVLKRSEVPRNKHGAIVLGQNYLHPEAKRYTVLKRLHLGYDSDTRHPTPRRVKFIEPGTVIWHQSTAPIGLVWFIDHENECGKTASGCIQNLLDNGTLELYEEEIE